MNKAMSRLACVFVLALAGAWLAGDARAEIMTKTITYKNGDVTLKGALTWDGAKSGKRPGILIVHEWWGLTDHAKNRAKKFAAEGYVAFALDMYGGGKITDHAKEAGEWAKQINSNIDNWMRRAQAGLAVLKSDANVDSARNPIDAAAYIGAHAGSHFDPKLGRLFEDNLADLTAIHAQFHEDPARESRIIMEEFA
jgi:hypothetical protein